MSERVLVVDDVALNVKLLADLLAVKGYAVSTAMSGPEALAKVASDAPDQQALVFEEFRQAGGDYLRKSEGTGLGLALANRFVELHGGTMRVESAPGKGSTFAFILPQRELEAAA